MNPFTEKICGVAIMAGGQSQRMGEDKMLLKIGGETLLERTARAASGSGGVYIVGRERPEGWPEYRGDFLPDDEPDLGPIGGLRTVLRQIGPNKRVIVIAGDLPRFNQNATLWLREKANALIDENKMAQHGLIVLNTGEWEPLFAVYSSDCLPLIEENIQAGRRSLRALIERGDFTFIHASHDIRRMLRNTNTPEEWAAFEAENIMTFDEARKIVEDDLRRIDEENAKQGHEPNNCLITQIWPCLYGWVFFYDSKKAVEMGDFRDFGMLGNAPYFILRTGELLYIPTSMQPETYLHNWEIVYGWRSYGFQFSKWDESWAQGMANQLLWSVINAEADELRFEPTSEGHRRVYYRDGEVQSEAQKSPMPYPVGLLFWRLHHMAEVEETDEYNFFDSRHGRFTVIMQNGQKYLVELLAEYTPQGERMILRFQPANTLSEKVKLCLWPNQK